MNGKEPVKKIAVGSLNPVKIAAVRNVAQRIWSDTDVIGISVPSGISVQPTSDQEAIKGAVNRAQLARYALQADLGLGLEGFTIDTQWGMFVSAWVAVVGTNEFTSAEIIGLGAGGRIQLPHRVAEVVRNGAELGPLMDQFVNQKNTKQKQGAIGILTDGLVGRTEALEIGVIYALARFIKPDYYA